MDPKKFNKHRSYLSQRLIKAREKKGLTQKHMQEMGVIDQSNLSKIEGGKRNIDVMLLIELAEIYEQPIEFFFLKPKIKITSRLDAAGLREPFGTLRLHVSGSREPFGDL